MTHDELLAKLNSYQCGSAFAEMFKNAVRAVVELHKPKLYQNDNAMGWYQNDNAMGCNQCSFFSFRYVAYPCPTIQAIEKELG